MPENAPYQLTTKFLEDTNPLRGLRRRPLIPPVASSVDAVNLGATAEISRLQELEQKVSEFTSMAVPRERGLPVGAAIAQGVLGAIAPDRLAVLQPEIDRFRQQPIVDFERKRATQAANIAAEAELAQAFTGAEMRQREQLDLQQSILAHYREANNIIDGTAQIAEEALASGDPLKEDFATELIKRTQQYRDLIAQAQDAEPGEIGPLFIDSADAALKGIEDLLNDERDFDQAVELARQANEAMLQRTREGAMMRAMTARANTQNKLFQEKADDYLQLIQFEDMIDEMKSLADGTHPLSSGGLFPGVGAVEGHFPTAAANRFDALASILVRRVFMVTGKALTATEVQRIQGVLAEVGDFRNVKIDRLNGALLEIQNAMRRHEVLMPGLAEHFSMFGGSPEDGGIPGMTETDVYGGLTIDEDDLYETEPLRTTGE